MTIETLTELLTVIETSLGQALPGVTVLTYPEYAKSIVLPAVVLKVDGFRVTPNKGHGQIAIRVRFEALAIVDATLAKSKLQAMELGLIVARAVHQQVWGLGIEAAHFDGEIIEDVWEPGLEQCQTVLVPWTHEVEIGKDGEWLIGLLPATAAVPAVPGLDGQDGTPAQPAKPVRTVVYLAGHPPDGISAEPSEVLFGLDPDTGLAHQDQYWPDGEYPPETL